MIEVLIAQFWPYILAAVGAVAGILGFGASQRARGRDQERSKQAAQDRKSVGVKNEVDRKIESLDDAAVRDRARQRMRDNRR